jgi:hypothetical protein
MHEKLTFHKDLYQQTIDNIRLYKEDIWKEDFIHKDIVRNLYNCMMILWWIEDMYHEKKVDVKWVSSDELHDYAHELNFEIMQLFSINKK